jgi:hypothetical protein
LCVLQLEPVVRVMVGTVVWLANYIFLLVDSVTPTKLRQDLPGVHEQVGLRIQVQHFLEGGGCCMARSYKQLSLEERSLLQTQLIDGLEAGGDRRRPPARSLHHHPARCVATAGNRSLKCRGRAADGTTAVTSLGPPTGAPSSCTPSPDSPQADPRHCPVAVGDPTPSPRLESGTDRVHTGSYARSGPALLRDHLHIPSSVLTTRRRHLLFGLQKLDCDRKEI